MTPEEAKQHYLESQSEETKGEYLAFIPKRERALFLQALPEDVKAQRIQFIDNRRRIHRSMSFEHFNERMMLKGLSDGKPNGLDIWEEMYGPNGTHITSQPKRG